MNSLPKRILILMAALVFAGAVGIFLGKVYGGNAVFQMQIGCIIAIPVVAILVVGPRVSKMYEFSPWVKFALWVAVMAIVLWCVFGYLSAASSVVLFPSQVKGYVAEQIWMALSGFIAGVAGTLFISGGLAKRTKASNQTELKSSH